MTVALTRRPLRVGQSCPDPGLNGSLCGSAVGTPFAPVTVPSPVFAFCQGTGESQQYLPTLTPSTTYQLAYSVGVRNGNTASYRVVCGDSSNTYYDSGQVSGNSSAMVNVVATFTTPATLGSSPNIQIWNDGGTGDYTVDYANVSLMAPAPPAPTVGNGGPVCAGSALSLSASVPSGYTATAWSWTGPNGFTSTAQNPTITGATTAAAGTYSCTYQTASTTCGTTETSVSATTTATVYGTPTTATVGGTQNICGGLTSGSLGGNTPSVGTGAWSLIQRSGDSELQQLRIGQFDGDGEHLWNLRVYLDDQQRDLHAFDGQRDGELLCDADDGDGGRDAEHYVGGLVSGSLGGNTPSVGTGAWSLMQRSGDSELQQLRIGQFDGDGEHLWNLRVYLDDQQRDLHAFDGERDGELLCDADDGDGG